MKLKTIRAHWYDTTTEPFGEFAGDVVPAAVAQKMLDALKDICFATIRKDPYGALADIFLISSNAIAAATEEP